MLFYSLGIYQGKMCGTQGWTFATWRVQSITDFTEFYNVQSSGSVHIMCVVFAAHSWLSSRRITFFRLVISCHLSFTIQKTQHLLAHWGEDQRCWRRKVLRTRRNRRWGVFRGRRTPENLLLRRFEFTVCNFNVWSYPLCQRGEVWGRCGTWRIREGSFVGTQSAHWQSWSSLQALNTGLCSLA